MKYADGMEPLLRFASVGEQLDPAIRADVLALGTAAVPDLIRFIEDETLQGEDSPSEGWAAVHACSLLAELKATEAIEPMLKTVLRTDWEELYFTLLRDIPKFGRAALEPAFSILHDDTTSRCIVISQLGVREPRVFSALCEFFAEDRTYGAHCLADYGDPAALPLLAQAIKQLEVGASPTWNVELVEMVAAHQRLAPLPPELKVHVDGLIAKFRESLRAAFPPAVLRMEVAGEKLDPQLRAEVVALGPAAVPSLIRIVEEDEFLEDKSREWAAFHAVEILCELKATDAIDVLLYALCETDWDDLIHDRLLQDLPKFGAVMVDPILALLDEDLTEDQESSLYSVLSQLGVRDSRIFELLKEYFEDDPPSAAFCLGDYGDPAGLPLLIEAIETIGTDYSDDWSRIALQNFVEAHEQIAPLSPSLRTRAEEHLAAFTAYRRAHTPARRAAEQVGRNDPCSCGSGLKFKKCCMNK